MQAAVWGLSRGSLRPIRCRLSMWLGRLSSWWLSSGRVSAPETLMEAARCLVIQPQKPLSITFSSSLVESESQGQPRSKVMIEKDVTIGRHGSRGCRLGNLATPRLTQRYVHQSLKPRKNHLHRGESLIALQWRQQNALNLYFDSPPHYLLILVNTTWLNETSQLHINVRLSKRRPCGEVKYGSCKLSRQKNLSDKHQETLCT